MNYQTVIFDLDGTLLDTTQGVLESVLYAVNTLGYNELPYESMLKFVGPPIQDSFMEFYGCSTEQAQQAAGLFREYYKERALYKAIPYDGIFTLLEKLMENKIKIAVATYKREDYALKLLKHFGFDKYCSSMHGADNYNVLKKQDIVRICLQDIGAETSSAVLIGDTLHDAKGAQQLGIDFIAVTYGFGFKQAKELDLYKKVAVCENVHEILRVII